MHCPDALKQVLRQMIHKPGHSGWDYLKSLYRIYGGLPLSTFQVWKDIAEMPDVMLTLLFRFELDQELILRLKSEFGIVWELIPLPKWLASVQREKSFIEMAGIPANLAAEILSGRIEKLCESIQAFNVLDLKQYLLSGEVSSQLTPIQAVEAAMYIWQQDLLRHQAELQWPEHFAEELSEWFKTNRSISLSLNVPNSFQEPVSYFPFFVAAVAAGVEEPEAVFGELDAAVKFQINELLSFDSGWFVSVYRSVVSHYLSVHKGVSP